MKHTRRVLLAAALLTAGCVISQPIIDPDKQITVPVSAENATVQVGAGATVIVQQAAPPTKAPAATQARTPEPAATSTPTPDATHAPVRPASTPKPVATQAPRPRQTIIPVEPSPTPTVAAVNCQQVRDVAVADVEGMESRSRASLETFMNNPGITQPERDSSLPNKLRSMNDEVRQRLNKANALLFKGGCELIPSRPLIVAPSAPPRP